MSPLTLVSLHRCLKILVNMSLLICFQGFCNTSQRATEEERGHPRCVLGGCEGYERSCQYVDAKHPRLGSVSCPKKARYYDSCSQYLKCELKDKNCVLSKPPEFEECHRCQTKCIKEVGNLKSFEKSRLHWQKCFQACKSLPL